jgi:phosphate/sulfate permease
LSPPPPLEGNDQLVTGIITAGWAIALIVLLIIRDRLQADVRWWIWTCVAGLALGLFGSVYLPRLKRSRTRAAESRARDQTAPPGDGQSALPGNGKSAPRDNGSNTVSSTDTPGRSTRS